MNRYLLMLILIVLAGCTGPATLQPVSTQAWQQQPGGAPPEVHSPRPDPAPPLQPKTPVQHGGAAPQPAPPIEKPQTAPRSSKPPIDPAVKKAVEELMAMSPEEALAEVNAEFMKRGIGADVRSNEF